jgi:hypothetical protein
MVVGEMPQVYIGQAGKDMFGNFLKVCHTVSGSIRIGITSGAMDYTGMGVKLLGANRVYKKNER